MLPPINMAVVCYGNKDQEAINARQFRYLVSVLKSFHLTYYDFHEPGQQEALLHNYQRGHIDVVLKNAYGRGHEADIEDFLELHGIPYLGSDARATLLGTSKLLSKQVFAHHQLSIAPHVVVDQKTWQKEHEHIAQKIGFPCIIKDSVGTDSRGIYYAPTVEMCRTLLGNAMQKHVTVIVEQYIDDAYETTCLVLDDGHVHAYPPLGLVKHGKIFSPDDKDNIAIKFEMPAALPMSMQNNIKDISMRAHQALGCQGFSRADILVKNGELYLLEVDVHPGFSQGSAATAMVHHAGDTLDSVFLKLYHYVRAHAVC